MRKIYSSGLQAFGYYRAEVTGLDQTESASAQAMYLRVRGSPSKTQHRSTSLLLMGDPCRRLALGPVFTWSSIVWKARWPGWSGGHLAAPLARQTGRGGDHASSAYLG